MAETLTTPTLHQIINTNPHRLTPTEVARLAAWMGDERKAAEIKILEIPDQAVLADYFVIMTGYNRRQIQAIAWETDRELKARGHKKLGLEGYETAWWVLLDYGSVVVHIFHTDARKYYDLDLLWGDGKELDWRTGGPLPQVAAKAAPEPGAPEIGDAATLAQYEAVPKPQPPPVSAEDLALASEADMDSDDDFDEAEYAEEDGDGDDGDYDEEDFDDDDEDFDDDESADDDDDENA